jgi:hypothetical protein
VHGGARFSAPARVDGEVLAYIRGCSALAPLHNPANADGIEVRAPAADSAAAVQSAHFGNDGRGRRSGSLMPTASRVTSRVTPLARLARRAQPVAAKPTRRWRAQRLRTRRKSRCLTRLSTRRCLRAPGATPSQRCARVCMGLDACLLEPSFSTDRVCAVAACCACCRRPG